MRYRYEDYPIDLLRQLLTYQELVKLFLQLVLQTGGDVEEALKWMRYLPERGIIDASIDLDEFAKALQKNEIVEDRNGTLELSAAGERRIRRSALEEIFTSLSRSGAGYHSIPRSGSGGDLLPETRPYEFGDNPTAIDGVRTIGNAARRDVETIAIQPDDFEVHEEEHLTSCATVLAIDISHSMILYGEDRFTPAKKVALARKLLQHKKNPNKQVFLITDGKPSAIWERGRLYKNPVGLDLKIVNRTLVEADACRRDGITITTFMIATDTYLVEFVDKLTRINRGRAYYASPYNLAEFLFTDYIRNRKKFLH